MSVNHINSMETDVMDTGGLSNEGCPSDHDPVMKIGEASHVLRSERGRGVSAKASSVTKDSYFSYLLLRHLKIRDTRRTVGVAMASQHIWCGNGYNPIIRTLK